MEKAGRVARAYNFSTGDVETSGSSRFAGMCTQTCAHTYKIKSEIDNRAGQMFQLVKAFAMYDLSLILGTHSGRRGQSPQSCLCGMQSLPPLTNKNVKNK